MGVSKEQLRKSTLELRRRMTFTEVSALSSRVQSRFMAGSVFASSARLALYSSFSNEVLTDTLFMGALDGSKEVYYPKVLAGGLEFLRVMDLDDLTPGTNEILEPQEGLDRGGLESLDLVVVPGIAFDTSGVRIGYGKGHYDRVLKGLKCPIVAFAYELQVMDAAIPVEAHDVRVTLIVTEERIIEI
jgi:5-formyltetrahydrofolate cyclo-ligase